MFFLEMKKQELSIWESCIFQISSFPYLFSPTQLEMYSVDLIQTVPNFRLPTAFAKEYGLFWMSLAQSYQIENTEYSLITIDA